MLIDRDRLHAFARFLWQRFLADRCFQSAGALAFTTLFSLVPLTAAVLGVLSAFPVFQVWRAQLTDFVFDNFVPSAGKAMQSYLTQFADNASQATAVGIVVLLVSAVALMASIEDAFNRIWRVSTVRSPTSRFLTYWTALSFGPLLVVTAMVISSYLFALPLFEEAAAYPDVKARFLGTLPFVIVWIGLAGSYLIVPNRTVRWRDAIIGAFLAALMFEGSKRGFTSFLSTLTTYEQVYGAVAAVPVFLLWIYLSWSIVLLGASVTAAMSAFEYRGIDDRLPPGHEFIGLLRVLHHFAEAQRDGRGLCTEDIRDRERFLTDDLLQRYLRDLIAAGMVSRTEHGAWVLSRNLETSTLLDLYEAGMYRLPLYESSGGPARIGLTPTLNQLLDRIAHDLRGALSVPLSEIFGVERRSDSTEAGAVAETPKESE